MPPVVANGRREEPRACSLCHLTTGDGHPESAGINGLPESYFIRTLNEFKESKRNGGRSGVMIAITKGMTEAEMKEAADYFTKIKQGGFYGWPYAYIGPNEDPRRKGERPDLVKKTIVPDVPLGAHVAVIDFEFYTGKMFPQQYQGGAFFAFHGSWNRSKRVGQSIGFIPFKNGKPSGPLEEFLYGWMLGPDKQEVWGRPVGLLPMTDGSLLVSEDGNNKIYRISYKGK